jgi:hypothetical protein
MIYITYVNYSEGEETEIKNLWDCAEQDIKDLYMDFLLIEGKERDICVNPYWKTIMNYKEWNNHLTETVYNKKEKQWNKFLKSHDIDWFIENILDGVKLSHKEIYF